MEKIASFRVDHDYILPGMYVSRIDGDVITFDLRTRRPNCGDYMDNITMHSIEHLMATLLRSGSLAERVIYFGPMGCQTGFYLLMRDVSPREAYEETVRVLREAASFDGDMPGANRKECGNYQNLDLGCAKKECAVYLNALVSRGFSPNYPEGDI